MTVVTIRTGARHRLAAAVLVLAAAGCAVPRDRATVGDAAPLSSAAAPLGTSDCEAFGCMP